jgi:hypothetical protein
MPRKFQGICKKQPTLAKQPLYHLSHTSSPNNNKQNKTLECISEFSKVLAHKISMQSSIAFYRITMSKWKQKLTNAIPFLIVPPN